MSKLLKHFFARAVTVSEAARSAGVSRLKMFRFVKRCETLGLLEVARTVPRKGRAIHYYQTSAREFFIPSKVLPLELMLEHIEKEAQQLFLRHFVQVITTHTNAHEAQPHDLGTRIFLEDDGVTIRLALRPGESWSPTVITSVAIFDLWVTLQVSLEEAKQLQQDLRELVNKYANSRGEFTYLLRLGLTPSV